MELRLKNLLELKAQSFEFKGDRSLLEKEISMISIDSRTIKPGDVYVAIKGEVHDGHAFVAPALAQGALAVIVEEVSWQRHLHELEGKPVFVVKDTLLALQHVANFYRKKFAIPVIGITGTNGKTTTKEMISAVLAKSGNVCKTEGNFNNHIGVPLTLFRLTSSDKFAVVEMGTNHFGEIATLCEIAEPDFGIITNIGHGHTEFLRDIQGVTKAKMELFNFVEKTGGLLFLNLEDPSIAGKADEFFRKRTFGFSGGEDITAKNLGMNHQGCATISVDGIEINLNLPGQHNAINALAAVAIGLEFGISLAEIKSALEMIKVPSKRMEVLTHNGVTIINDCYNANPESTLSALKTLAGFNVSGKKYFVLGDMLELGKNAAEQHADIGRKVADFGVAALFAFGPLAKNVVENAPTNVLSEHFENKTGLTSKLKPMLKSGDLVLIKGSRGMKMEEVLEGILN